MSPPPLTPRDLLDVLAMGRRVAFELADEATDPTKPLTMAARRALADLAVAVDEAVASRVGVAPLGDATRAQFAAAVDRIAVRGIPP